MHRLIFLLPLLAFAGLAVYLASGLTRDPGQLPSALIDKPVPEFALPPLKDDKPGLDRSNLVGEVRLVNVFASWCMPCRAEHPLFMRLAEDNVVPVYGINWKDKQADATAWLAELGDPYQRIGHDLDGRAGIEWGVYGVPETYVVDREGRIRYKHVGPLFDEVLTREILPLIEDLRG